MKRKFYSRGFTLVESMVTITVFGVAMTCLMAFYMQCIRGGVANTQRILQGSNIRKFTNELSLQAIRANEFILYASSTPADWNDVAGGDRLFVNYPAAPAAAQHPAGDFAVFVYYELPKPATVTKTRIRKIQGYYLAVSGGSTGRLRKVTFDCANRTGPNAGVPWDPSTADGPVEQIMTDNWGTMAVFSDFLINIRGLSLPDVVVPTTVSRLFYMQDARSLIVSGQIFQANNDVIVAGMPNYTFTDSFNFVVTPRS